LEKNQLMHYLNIENRKGCSSCGSKGKSKPKGTAKPKAGQAVIRPKGWR
jgi:hypothetical protein